MIGASRCSKGKNLLFDRSYETFAMAGVVRRHIMSLDDSSFATSSNKMFIFELCSSAYLVSRKKESVSVCVKMRKMKS